MDILLLSITPVRMAHALGMPGVWEMAVILVIVLVIFGPGKMSQVGESMGDAIRGFRKATRDPELRAVKEELEAATDAMEQSEENRTT